MKEPAAVTPEFSRPLPADSVGPQPLLRRIEAGPAEREGLARRFDLLGLDRLEAALELSREKGEVIRLQGHLTADVVQSCVVTLGPVPAHLEVDFEMSFSASAVEPAVADLDPMAEEGPEPWGKPWPSSSPSRWTPIRGPPGPVWRPWRRPSSFWSSEHGTLSRNWRPSRRRRDPVRNEWVMGSPARRSCPEPRTRLNNARLRCPDCRVAPGLAVP